MPETLDRNPATVMGEIIERIQGEPLAPYQREHIALLERYCGDATPVKLTAPSKTASYTTFPFGAAFYDPNRHT